MARELDQAVVVPNRIPTLLALARRLPRPRLRSAVLASSALVVLLLAFAIATRTSDQLRESAIESAVGNAESIVRGYVDPIVTEGSLNLGAVPDAEVDAQLDRLVASGDMRRLNVFTRDGRIMYSTEASLTGLRVDIDEELSRAFGGSTVAEFGTNDEFDESTATAAGALPGDLRSDSRHFRRKCDWRLRGVHRRRTDRAASLRLESRGIPDHGWRRERAAGLALARLRRLFTTPWAPEPDADRAQRAAAHDGRGSEPARGSLPVARAELVGRRDGSRVTR